jgi:Rv0078B-related antitoxin
MAAADVEKFQVVFDMCDAGVRMYRQRMRRENPAASDEEIEARVQAWLRRPSGEAGDRPVRASTISPWTTRPSRAAADTRMTVPVLARSWSTRRPAPGAEGTGKDRERAATANRNHALASEQPAPAGEPESQPTGNPAGTGRIVTVRWRTTGTAS